MPHRIVFADGTLVVVSCVCHQHGNNSARDIASQDEHVVVGKSYGFGIVKTRQVRDDGWRWRVGVWERAACPLLSVAEDICFGL